MQYEKITEDLPSAEALPPPRQPIRHARRRKPGGRGRDAMRIEVEITRQVEADEGRATPTTPAAINCGICRSCRDQATQLANLRWLGASRRALGKPMKSNGSRYQLSRE